ncbi:cell division protein SepF [Brooklawnia sp.]|uniref:cell division protein SepF n=1 Tax=Brooklawnia sp. TaxID=2699740 RepID=UPI00311D4DCA
MAQGIRKAAAWLGLVRDEEDERYGDDVEQFSEPIYGYEQPEEVSTVTPINRRPSQPDHYREPSATDSGAAEPIKADLGRIITVHPRAFNEARTIGEHFRDGVPVIMNLTDMEDADARRLIDFGAGLIFGLRGTIERVTSKVFLLSPNNVNVTAEDKERIKGGFFNQS